MFRPDLRWYAVVASTAAVVTAALADPGLSWATSPTPTAHSARVATRAIWRAAGDSVELRFWAKPPDGEVDADKRPYRSVFSPSDTSIGADIWFAYDPGLRFGTSQATCTILQGSSYGNLPPRSLSTAIKVGDKWVFTYFSLTDHRGGFFTYDCHVNGQLIASGTYERRLDPRPPESSSVSASAPWLRAWLQPANGGKFIPESQRAFASVSGRHTLSLTNGAILLWELVVSALPTDAGYYGPTVCYYLAQSEAVLGVFNPQSWEREESGYASYIGGIGVREGPYTVECRNRGQVLARLSVTVVP